MRQVKIDIHIATHRKRESDTHTHTHSPVAQPCRGREEGPVMAPLGGAELAEEGGQLQEGGFLDDLLRLAVLWMEERMKRGGWMEREGGQWWKRGGRAGKGEGTCVCVDVCWDTHAPLAAP